MNISIAERFMEIVGVEEIIEALVSRKRDRLDVARVTKLFGSNAHVRASTGEQTDSQDLNITPAATSALEVANAKARAARVKSIGLAVTEGRYSLNRTGLATALYRDLM